MHATTRQCGKARTTRAKNLNRHDADSLVGTGYRKQPPKSVDRILHVRWQRLPDPQYRLVKIKVEAVHYRALRAGEKPVREPRSDCSMGRRFKGVCMDGKSDTETGVSSVPSTKRGVNVSLTREALCISERICCAFWPRRLHCLSRDKICLVFSKQSNGHQWFSSQATYSAAFGTPVVTHHLTQRNGHHASSSR